jgi:hypothetical protein
VKYWIDTEIIARPYTIDLISIGLVAEDGRFGRRTPTSWVGSFSTAAAKVNTARRR